MNIFLDLAPLPYEIEAMEKTSAAAAAVIIGAVAVLAAVVIIKGIKKKK